MCTVKMSKIIVPLLAAFVLFAAISGSPLDDELVQAFRQHLDPDWYNVVSVPDNCKEGYVLINGVCREVWSAVIQYLEDMQFSNPDYTNVVSVPDNCPPGEKLVGEICKEIWRKEQFEDFDEAQKAAILRGLLASSDFSKNIISVPTQCPEGTRPDANGYCREVWG